MRRWLLRFLFLNAIVWTILFCAGCSIAWTGEAVNIIKVLVPAIEAVLGLVAAFGAKIPPDIATEVENWANQATNALTNEVAPLITQYQNALPAAKPGLLVEIETAVQTIVNNLKTILLTIHIVDPASQAKVTAIVNAILAELESLANVIPVLQGVKNIQEINFKMPLDAGHFRQKFNHTMTEPTGDPEVDELTKQFTVA